MSDHIVLQGNCLDVLKDLPDNSIDAVVTDPPYGLSFMGKKWDYDVPKTEIWKEVLRVLKPGGHLLSFGGTRTYHRMVVAIEDAGFDIRDQIQWIYGSGFPKSHNIKDGPFKGFGTALKPANEPIVLARKPLEDTVAKNIEKWGCGGLAIDQCRIETDDDTSRITTNIKGGKFIGGSGKGPIGGGHAQGRWPANVMFDEEAAAMLDEQVKETMPGMHSAGSAVDRWDETADHNGVEFLKSGGAKRRQTRFGDSGGASRFFYCAKASKSERNRGLDMASEEYAEVEDARLNKDASDNPNTKGRKSNPIDGLQNKKRQQNGNHHPTVKPLRLMEYLCRLITPPGGIILDPFCGSGSTGVAAKRLGFGFVGCEMNEEYVEIAEKRIKAA